MQRRRQRGPSNSRLAAQASAEFLRGEATRTPCCAYDPWRLSFAEAKPVSLLNLRWREPRALASEREPSSPAAPDGCCRGAVRCCAAWPRPPAAPRTRPAGSSGSLASAAMFRTWCLTLVCHRGRDKEECEGKARPDAICRTGDARPLTRACSHQCRSTDFKGIKKRRGTAVNARHHFRDCSTACSVRASGTRQQYGCGKREHSAA